MTRKVHALPEDELAALAGVSETTWKAHKKAGAPVPRTREGLPAWLKDYHAWKRQNGKTGGAPPPEIDADTINSKRELAKLRVVLARIEVGEKMGTLVPRQEVLDTNGRAALAVRLRLNALVKHLASELGPLCGKGGEAYVEEKVQTAVDSILDAFARGLWGANEEQPPPEAETVGSGP